MPIERHRWVHVAARGRAPVVAGCAEEWREAVNCWLACGIPLVARARQTGEASHLQGVGLCLPRAKGKARVALAVDPSDISRVDEPVALRDVAGILAPAATRVARELVTAGEALGFEARAFGSAAWQWRTGEDYLDAGSDLDLLAAPGDRRALDGWLAALARIDGQSPMRLDGEVETPDGEAVNWRELAGGARTVLVKSRGGARLMDCALIRERFP